MSIQHDKTASIQAAIGLLEVDNQGVIQSFNSQAEQLLQAKIASNNTLESIDSVLAMQVLSCISSSEQEKKSLRYNIIRKEREIQITITPIMNDDGTQRAICLMQGSETLEAAAWQLTPIKEMHLQLQTLLDHSYYGIYILDGKGIVLRVNDVAAGLIGLTKEEMIGMNIRDLAENGIVDQALTPTILESKKPLTLPLYVIKSNKYIMASGMPIFDENGDILFVVVIEHDMTIVKDLRSQLEQAKQVAETVRSELSYRNLLELKNSEIVADAPAMNQVLTVLLKLAKMDASNILITGESGTGKGLLAKFVHHTGTRNDQPFISINCAALPDMLLEAELFGYEKGAFTGASDSGKAGLFELANKGTIFLDEIGDLPFSVQAKLLKCLDDGEIRRLGGTKAIKVDCIVIAATNHNLEELVERKKFRHDLYFRLNIFPVQIPPLRERREDVVKISKLYLDKYNKIYKQKKRFSELCIEQLLAYNFPGNVRELKNLIKNAVVIKEKDVLERIVPNQRIRTQSSKVSQQKDVPVFRGLIHDLQEFERKKLEQALAKFGSTRDLAEYLDISQSSVVRKLRKHGLSAG